MFGVGCSMFRSYQHPAQSLFPNPPRSANLFLSSFGMEPVMEMKLECPSCKRPLASRRHKLCQYCGAELPAELLFSKEEMEAANRAWDEEQKKIRLRHAKEDEEEKARHASGSDISPTFMF
jgi:hypothetical protein